MSTALKYTDFPSGTYDTSKIFLQADPITGALEKVNLPAISSGATYYCNAPYANNSGTNPETSATISIPANSLVNVGDSIEIKAAIKFNTSSGTKTVEFRINGVSQITRTATAADNGWLSFTLVAVSTNTVQTLGTWFNGVSFAGFKSLGTISFTFNAANTLSLVVTSGIANDIRTGFISALVLNV